MLGYTRKFMDETYDSWQEINSFYALLDTMKGLDYEGIVTDKAQVTGVIHVPDIPYADYIRLSANYPEVVIDAEAIVCSVTFMNEDTVHNEQKVNQA